MKALLHSRRNGSLKSPNAYATHGDFCKIFTEDMAGLHLLALLLTGDPALAEQCFVEGFEDSIHSNRIFKQWAHSWSRRAIIKNAIRMVRPSPSEAGTQVVSHKLDAETTISASLAAVFHLQPFERFVLVMSVLEGYTGQDCATLLNCARQDVIASRSRALQQLAQADANPQTTPEPAGQLLHTDGLLPFSGAA